MSDPKRIPEADLERLRRSSVFLSLSGGKDSTACGLLLREHEIEFRAIFADTGWEHPDTLAYVKSLEPLFGPIQTVGYQGGMRQLVIDRRGFPARTRRFCTEQLKRVPLTLAQTSDLRPQTQEPISVTGIRAEESAARSKMMPWELTETPIKGRSRVLIWSFRPLLNWTLADVVEIHRRHKVRPNPLYLRGFKRVGCFPCILARKDEIRRIADQHPEIIEEIAGMERAATAEAMERTGDSRPRTFFMYRLGRNAEEGGSWPIERVVAWSRSKGQEAQPGLGLADPNDDGGCGTWGLCEHTEEGFDV